MSHVAAASPLTILSMVDLLGGRMSLHAGDIIIKSFLSWRISRAYMEFLISSDNSDRNVSIMSSG